MKFRGKIWRCLGVLLLLLAAAFTAEAGWNAENLALIPRDREEFSFAVVGDTQGPGSKFPVISKAILAEEGLLFAFDLGDLVNYATLDEYESTFFRYVRGQSLPFLTAASNHDHFKSKNAANYSQLFGAPHYYSFTVGRTHFIVLDNGQDYSMTEQQLLWLEQELAQSQHLTHRFVMMHRPLHDPRDWRKKPHDMSGRPDNVKRLNDLFDKYKVTRVFTGHIHSYYSGVWGKTPYIITGGGGGGLYDKGTPASFHHYLRVDIGSDGSAKISIRKVSLR